MHLAVTSHVTMCYPGTTLNCGMRPVEGPGDESSTINHHKPQRHKICNLLFRVLAFAGFRKLNPYAQHRGL